MNFMKFTTCFTPHHRWRGYRTSWPAKDVIGISSRYIAPHFRGLWEAAVKSMKYHLRQTLGSHIATYEELSTLLAEIEVCLNSRPLCALSDDPFNTTYLSPGHFLIGEPLTQLPGADYTNVKCNRLSRWQPTNNNFSSSGNNGHPTTFRAFNSVNDGKGHLLTYK